jgi:uncharacterized protein (TIGR03437 family)
VLNKNLLLAGLVALAGATAVYAQSAVAGPTYRFETNLGNIDVVLMPSVAPNTVANFLSYVNSGAYTNAIIDRSVPGFVEQGGDYTDPGALPLLTASPAAITQNAAINNEFNLNPCSTSSTGCNVQGTIAMALSDTSSGTVNINSATSVWFFNLVNNVSQLDSQMFTVFGQTNAAGITVLNKIQNLAVTDYSSLVSAWANFPFTNLPTTGASGNFVLVNSIIPLPVLTPAGFVSAASYAATSTNGVSPGEILAIFGTQMGPANPVSSTITNGALPTSVAGTTVTFDSKPAPIFFTYANQVNVVVPYSIAGLPTVDITVTYNGTASNAEVFQVKPANPAIFTLNALGTGDAVIERYPGYASDVISASNPAKAGDVLILYGEGYGAPTSGTSLPDGQIVSTTVPVVADTPAVLLIDGNPVPTQYFGGAPGLVNGVLQVNFTVPTLAPGSHQIQLQLGSPARTSPTGVTLATK